MGQPRHRPSPAEVRAAGQVGLTQRVCPTSRIAPNLGKPWRRLDAVFRLLALGLVVVGAWFGYQKLQDLDRDDVPAGTQYVPVTPPDVSINVPKVP